MKIRIISAAVAAVIGAVVLVFRDTLLFNAAVGLICVLMLFELFKADECLKFKIPSAICFIFAMLMSLSQNFEALQKSSYLLVALCIFALMIAFLTQHESLAFDKLCFMITTTVLITLSMGAILTINDISENHGLFYVLITLLGAWLADTGAYFTGTLIGKHKLCPQISPKKTVEGLVGGTVTNAVLFVVFAFLYSEFLSPVKVVPDYAAFVFLGVACSVLGLVGDLTASLIKRQCHIKDYGNIMPGHGGMMDRFDSVLFVAPFMLIVISQYKNLLYVV